MEDLAFYHLNEVFLISMQLAGVSAGSDPAMEKKDSLGSHGLFSGPKTTGHLIYLCSFLNLDFLKKPQ